MQLEKQVVSLELAKKLKELGVKQESLYYWVDIDIDEWHLIHSEELNLDDKCISAFTVAELGELLKFNIEADARAKMLVYLLENNLTPLSAINR